MTNSEILTEVNSIGSVVLTDVTEIKKTPRVLLVRMSDVRGDIYMGANNNNFYFCKNQRIFKVN